MKVAVTGPDGFVAWHTRCAARARWGGDLVGVDREDFDDPAAMDRKLQGVDALIHLAGVNRAPDESTISRVNPWLATRLIESLERIERTIPVIFGNSIHSAGDSAFGRAKRKAAEIPTDWGDRSGAPVVDVVLPNLFGEHGRAHYNSVVATFCQQIADGDRPAVVDDKEIPLMHVQAAVATLLDQVARPSSGRVELDGRLTWVSELEQRLQDIASGYRTGTLPDLHDAFTQDLFNTYRSYVFPKQFPIYPTTNEDPRGGLVEAVKGLGGQTQVFYSTTNPGYTRGQHFHLRKVERFLVVSGRAQIRLRRLFSSEIVSFNVSGDRPAIIDMPTMWVHSITNVGDQELTTLFYADEVFDAANPDTYAEEI